MKYSSLFLVLSVTAVYATTSLDTRHPRETVTLDYFLESCTVIGETANGMIPYFDCESYLYGVLDTHKAIRKQLPNKQRACFPDQIAPWQVYQILLDTPQKQTQQTAAQAIIEILRNKYPCF